MNSYIAYILESSVLLAMMFGVYWMFLRKETFFRMNRLYLLLTLILPLVLPLLPLRFTGLAAAVPVILRLDPVLITPERIGSAMADHLTWFEMVSVAYFTGAGIFFLRFIFRLVQIRILIMENGVRNSNGINLVITDRHYAPFSVFNYVFIHKDYLSNDGLNPILSHEKVHIRQFHTLDLLLTETVSILQWFNPFVWLTGKSVKGVHEFLADEGVLREGYASADYLALILRESTGIQLNFLTNNFNVLSIKKRITMIKKTRSAAWAPMKALLALPVILTVMFLFSSGSLNFTQAQDKASKEVITTKERPTDTKGTEVYQTAEKQPEYPGGQEEMIRFLSSNIKYPEAAMKNNTQGTVYVTFLVKADGSVTDVKIIRGIGKGCDEESIRVVKLMPKWVPGQIKGKNVDVQFTLPIRFALGDGEKKGEEPKKK